VTGSGFIVLAATLASVGTIPVASIVTTRIALAAMSRSAANTVRQS
jgi:Na+/H+-dicarboxylate symporter